MSTILITRSSGFLGNHCVVAASKAGHEVCTTLRSLDKEPQLRAMLESPGRA